MFNQFKIIMDSKVPEYVSTFKFCRMIKLVNEIRIVLSPFIQARLKRTICITNFQVVGDGLCRKCIYLRVYATYQDTFKGGYINVRIHNLRIMKVVMGLLAAF